MNEEIISTFIEQQFPSIYREEGPFFVEFVKQYYKWLETEQNSPVYQARKHLQNHDIDTTVNDFVIYFKEKYLKNIQFNTATDTERLIKNAIDLYRSKGTENSIKLFFDLIFTAPSEVYYPGKDVFRLSSSEWFIPKYIEISSKLVNRLMVGRVIHGVNSGATAYVERLVRKKVNNAYIEVFYLSAIKGNFETGELVRIDVDGYEAHDWPEVTGSLTSLEVVTGGSDFAIGDVVNLTSRTGTNGKAIVTDIKTIGGQADFNLITGGWGYTTETVINVSEKVMRLSNVSVTSSSNSSVFGRMNNLVQPLANVQWYDNTAMFSVGDTVYNYDEDDNLIGISKIISAEYGTSNTSNYFLLNTISGNTDMDANAAVYYTAGNTASFKVHNAGFVDVTASANVIGNIESVLIRCTGDYTPFNIEDTVYQLSSYNSRYVEAKVNRITSLGANSFVIGVDDIEGMFLSNQPLYREGSNTAYSITSMGYDVGLIDITNSFRPIVGNMVTRIGTDDVTIVGTANVVYTGSGANVDYEDIFTNVESVLLNTDYVIDHMDESNSENWVNSASYGDLLNNADGNTVLADALNFDSFDVGTLYRLTNRNPGSDYSRAPIVEVIDPLVAPLNKLDFVISLANTTGVFAEGETITQEENDAIGLVKFTNTTHVHVRRLTFDDRWEVGTSNDHVIVGSITGFRAYPSDITSDVEGVAGKNAIIEANVSSSNASVSSLKVSDSGIGFRDLDSVIFTSEDGERLGTAIASVKTTGTGSGRFKNRSGFLSDNNFLHDGYYYQDFSYEIKSPITVSRYSDMLKNVLHVAGTQLFSSISKTTNISSVGTIIASEVEDFVTPISYYLKLDLDFLNTEELDSRVTFTRSSTATYFNAEGLLVTANNNVPRFDHVYNPITELWEPAGLLIEEQRTNLIRYSGMMEHVTWTGTNSTVTGGQALAPDGTMTMALFTRGSTVAAYRGMAANKAEAALPFTFSIFAKKSVGDHFALRIQGAYPSRVDVTFDLTNGTISRPVTVAGSFTNGSAKIYYLGDDLYWVVVTATSDTAASVSAHYSFNSNNTTIDGVDSASNSAGYVWGAQLEQASFPSSYIPTTSAAATRAVDDASMTGTNFSRWFNPDEGTFVAEALTGPSATSLGNPSTIVSANDTYSEYIGLEANSRFRVLDGGATQASITPLSFTSNAVMRVVGAYKLNDFAAAANGVLGPVVDTSGTLPTPNRLSIGAAYAGSLTGLLNGHIRRFIYYSRRLPNDQLQEIST